MVAVLTFEAQKSIGGHPASKEGFEFFPDIGGQVFFARISISQECVEIFCNHLIENRLLCPPLGVQSPKLWKRELFAVGVARHGGLYVQVPRQRLPG